MPFSLALEKQVDPDRGKPPQFIEGTAQFKQGDDHVGIILSVEFEGEPMPDMKWYRQESYIKPCERFIQRVELVSLEQKRYKAVMMLKNPKNEDADTYQCKLVNSAGTGVCDINISRLTGYDALKLSAPATIDYLGNASCEMHAGVYGVIGETQIAWSKQKATGKLKKLIQSERFSFSAECNPTPAGLETRISCIINGFKKGDIGHYVCKVTDHRAELLIEFPLIHDRDAKEKRPLVYSSPRVFHKKDNSIVMIFWVKSQVPPAFEWILPGRKFAKFPCDTMTFDTRTIQNPKNSEVLYEAKFVLHNYHSAILGDYECVVKNIYGRVMVPFHIAVDPAMQDLYST